MRIQDELNLMIQECVDQNTERMEKIRDIKLSIYEKADAGEITALEMRSLLDSLSEKEAPVYEMSKEDKIALAAIGTVTAGMIAIPIVKNKMDKKKFLAIEEFYKKNDPDFVPLSKAEMKIYKVSKLNGEDVRGSELGKIRQALRFGNKISVFSYGGKEICAYSVCTEVTGHSSTVTVGIDGNLMLGSGKHTVNTFNFNLIDSSKSKYKQYYTAAAGFRAHIATNECVQWINAEYKKIKALEKMAENKSENN